MPTPDPMFCRKCYANLDQAIEGRCLRCKKPFDPANPSTYLPTPFPSRGKIIAHSVITLGLTTIVSAIVAGFLAVLQVGRMHSGH